MATKYIYIKDLVKRIKELKAQLKQKIDINFNLVEEINRLNKLVPSKAKAKLIKKALSIAGKGMLIYTTEEELEELLKFVDKNWLEKKP